MCVCESQGNESADGRLTRTSIQKVSHPVGGVDLTQTAQKPPALLYHRVFFIQFVLQENDDKATFQFFWGRSAKNGMPPKTRFV